MSSFNLFHVLKYVGANYLIYVCKKYGYTLCQPIQGFPFQVQICCVLISFIHSKYWVFSAAYWDQPKKKVSTKVEDIVEWSEKYGITFACAARN